ncbi:MAG: hypothetical protein ABJG15_05730 [Hyphomonadaceae bacterium]
MTANGTAGGSMNLIGGVLALLHKAGRLIRQIMLGGLFVVAAGIVAVATAFLGVLVASAALTLRFSGRKPVAAGKSQSAQSAGSSPVTLEARQTGEGWTVE